MSVGDASIDGIGKSPNIPNIRLRLREEQLSQSCTRLENGRFKTDFIVPGMHCAGCISAIERGVADCAAVEQVRANLSQKTVSVIWDARAGKITDIADKLTELGFEFHVGDRAERAKKYDTTGRQLLSALAVAGFAAANIMLLSVSVWAGAEDETKQLFHIISGLIAVPAVIYAGRPFFRSAYAALMAKRLNMDVPISLAVLMALGMSLYESLHGVNETYFDASVTLLFFLLIGRYLDHIMRQKALGATGRLSSLTAKGGVRIGAGNNLSHIPLDKIAPGMALRVFPGERFPVDGTVTRGSSDLDRSHVTGESDSVHVSAGKVIEAGTLNLTAAVDIVATSTADRSFLADMRQMMEAAEKGHGVYVRIADRMAQIYAPAVHGLALVTFIGWMIASNGDWHTAIYTAIAVLIITCPCALGLAVPVAHVIGANRLLQNGILMRDGGALERLADIDFVLFDKTGTLTTGKPCVSRMYCYDRAHLPIVRGMTAQSNHPLSRATDSYLKDIVAADIDASTNIPGYGVEARYRGKRVRFGKPEWASEILPAKPVLLEAYSASFAHEDGGLVHFDIEDARRQDAEDAVENLAKNGLALEILSGDHPVKVASLAQILGIRRYRSDQTPAAKLERISELTACNRKPLMIGDGINDAPALAAGYVSMAPASASDIGRQAADFIFTRPSLLAVPIAYAIAAITKRVVRQNFALALTYNAFAIPLAMAGLVTPLIAAIAMSASSLAVVANSFRIMACAVDVPVKTGEGLVREPINEAGDP